jgi:hypothetical protein
LADMFQSVLMPVMTGKLLPMIEHTIEREFERLNFNLKSKVCVPKFKEMLAEIN